MPTDGSLLAGQVRVDQEPEIHGWIGGGPPAVPRKCCGAPRWTMPDQELTTLGVAARRRVTEYHTDRTAGSGSVVESFQGDDQ
jgi:hypothetical protein